MSAASISLEMVTEALPDLTAGRPRKECGHVRPAADVAIPFALIEGEQPGPLLLVTAGVHGSEYCSIESALRLLQLEPQDIRGTLLVLPILNVHGFRRRSIYVMPEDGKNLNRMFPGRADGTTSERLAHWLVGSVFPHFDAYLDLHGGDLDEALLPFSLFPTGSAESQELAETFGLPIAVAAGGEGYTINAASRVGVPSVLAEVGGNGLWDEAGVAQLTAGIRRVMARIGMVAEAPPPEPAPQVVTMWVPTAASDGLWYPAKGLAASVAAGEEIGQIRDVFGTTLASVRSEREGFILYTLSSLAVNKGEALLGVGTPLRG